jgi:hypothetical protein
MPIENKSQDEDLMQSSISSAINAIDRDPSPEPNHDVREDLLNHLDTTMPDEPITPVQDDRRPSSELDAIKADDDLMAMIESMTKDESAITQDTIAKAGLQDNRSNYSTSMLAFIFGNMIIGLLIVIIAAFTSNQYPIPFLGVWNLIIGVFLAGYGSLFLLNWKR